MINIKKISVAELFSKFHVTLKEAWLNEVLEYLHVERAEADVSTVIQLVYEQWLYSELSNSTRPKIRLPPFEKKTSLDSDVVVQINWLIDIHTSMYSKLNEYVGRNTDNSFFQWELNDGTENLDSTNRMYLMEVTDGQRKMRAIEYQKIDKLCDKLSSGTKLLIYGGTICRRNVLLLTSNNVMILGGESEICQQNIPALVVARRLGIDEKKLKLIECVRNKGHENSVKTVKELETQGAEKVQITIPSVLMSENTAINSDAQQSKTMRISKTIKGEKVKEKKQKRPVLSRTITSYFRPQRKVSTSETSSKVIIKSQMPLVDQKIKEEPKSKYLLLDPLRKQEEVEPPSPLLPTIDSKQQSEYSTATTPPRESKKTSAEQSGSSVVSSRMLSTQKIINELGMQSELREITTKSIATMHCQSRNVQNLHASPQFRMQSENASLSAGLKNLETTRSLVVEEKNFILPPRKRDNTIILSGENERREIVTKPVIPIRTTELQRKSADAILHTTVISSSDIQESMIWTANKWQHAINEDSKQFLTNEFRVPTSEVQIQTVDNNNASSIDPSSIHGPLNSLQNCPPEEVNEIAVAQTSFNLQEEQVVGGKGSQIIQHGKQ
uniref:RecQ-mediated genome instability protein 1 n=1 Tax=Onchocerca volvulus TaxID=6282 RepID=A0A8R1TXW9_ONCVO